MRRRAGAPVAAFALLHAAPGVADPPPVSTPIGFPQRPFLVLDAPRRFLPRVAASVRLRTTLGGPVEIAVYRVLQPRALVATPLGREGVRVAETPLGAEAEALLVRAGALPRHGALLDLISDARVDPRAGSVAADEGDREARDWGATDQPWGAFDLAVGALPAGLYLVRALAGGWAASSLLSVGSLTLLVRRGDGADRVIVTDEEGAPQGGVAVQRIVGGAVTAARATSARGEATFPASDDFEVRYAAARAGDVAWADAAHVRASACDLRVELATGRPAYALGETVSVRGYLRGCDGGTDATIANERVELVSGASPVTVTTGADGSFVAALPAAGELVARVRGVEHRRPLAVYGAPGFLAERPLYLGFDRAWAAPGETVTATVGDEGGAWPREAQVRYSIGDVQGATRIAPGYPGMFTFVMPPASAPLGRLSVRAEVTELTRATYTTHELWTGTDRALFDRPADWTEAPVDDGTSLRPRTPAPSRDPVDVLPARALVTPGETLSVGLRAPALGATLLTLERGDVWSSRYAPAGSTRAELPVTAGARGLATVVATHVHAGEVQIASAPVEVATSRGFAVRVTTDRLDYPGGASARVTVSARDGEGRPRDVTATLWVADAAWWELGPDANPPPDRRLRGVERPAGRGDSATPRGDGSDEGRRFETLLAWNGRALPGASFRQAWSSAWPTLRFDARGSFTELARRIATVAGLGGATVCPETERALGVAHLRVQNVPWDLAAVRIAEATRTAFGVDDDRTLHFDCPEGEGTIGMGNIGTMGHGSGFGSGQGYGSGSTLRRSIGGAVAFVGALRTGPSGGATVDVPLPAHPGRWRFEVLALAQDGARGTTHVVATTH